jgi:hypothetical protein
MHLSGAPDVFTRMEPYALRERGSILDPAAGQPESPLCAGPGGDHPGNPQLLPGAPARSVSCCDLNELAVANKIHKEKTKDFIIQLWIDDLPSDDFNIEIGRLNPVRFQHGWAKGLAGLLKKLEEDGVAKKPGFGPAAVMSWWRDHAEAKSGLQMVPETLVTNWYPLEPAILYCHELTRSGVGPLDIPWDLPYPGFRHKR